MIYHLLGMITRYLANEPVSLKFLLQVNKAQEMLQGRHHAFANMIPDIQKTEYVSGVHNCFVWTYRGNLSASRSTTFKPSRAKHVAA